MHPSVRPAVALRDEDVRQLLSTALRLRHGKAQSSLPEQLMAVFIQYYRRLDGIDRLALFHNLTASFGVQAAEVDAAAASWQALRAQHAQPPSGLASDTVALGGEPLVKAAAALAAAATPRYARLFVPLSQQPGGIKFLVDMRADLLQAIQEQPSGAAPLRALSDALRASLAEWFSVGLLQLRRISWEASSAELLEKVAAGEAVHAFASWRDLKGRLDDHNRRCYAFFHEAMPGEPLVVLHTALTHSVAGSMDDLLPPAAHEARLLHVAAQARHHAPPPSDRTWEDPPAAGQEQLRNGQRYAVQQAAPEEGDGQAAGGAGEPETAAGGPTVAVFYSISATQKGLAGVDLGNFLIKQVAHRVVAEFPSVHTLCTLSPLPGFSDWLRLQLARAAQQLPPAAPLLLPDEAAALEAVAAGHLPSAQPAAAAQQEADGSGRAQGGPGGPPSSAADAAALAQEQQQQQRAAALLSWALADDAWLHSSRLEAAVQRPLLRLAAHYLLRERRRGLSLDPVANFHLRNGASVLRLNWRGDTSAAGLARSHGLMVNYQYELDKLADNNRAYLVSGVVGAAPAVRALLREGGGG
ncbi:hypothetical protein COHA_010093 [Chlorella ohadii]|uniref:Malonyl-CoA decarboxylase n=1 Tax=Chlorella ohadii TaxID=2649997 RepID=A0AAD5DKH9_9CHLO|nr:hypothetical protein COHA_010093 [Chlorella ohadii]